MALKQGVSVSSTDEEIRDFWEVGNLCTTGPVSLGFVAILILHMPKVFNSLEAFLP
jgi:hypothetical protein